MDLEDFGQCLGRFWWADFRGMLGQFVLSDFLGVFYALHLDIFQIYELSIELPSVLFYLRFFYPVSGTDTLDH